MEYFIIPLLLKCWRAYFCPLDLYCNKFLSVSTFSKSQTSAFILIRFFFIFLITFSSDLHTAGVSAKVGPRFWNQGILIFSLCFSSFKSIWYFPLFLCTGMFHRHFHFLSQKWKTSIALLLILSPLKLCSGTSKTYIHRKSKTYIHRKSKT